MEITVRLLRTLESKMVMYSIISDWVNGIFRGIGKAIELNITSKKPSGQIKFFCKPCEFNLHMFPCKHKFTALWFYRLIKFPRFKINGLALLALVHLLLRILAFEANSIYIRLLNYCY